MKVLLKIILGYGLAASSFGLSVVGPHSTLEIVNKFISPDGFNRSAVLVNGEYPAPLIKAKKGDNFELNVVDRLHDNSMDTALTIHWHGIFQNRTTYNDGVAFVSQCPIIPGESYEYKFAAPGQAGTFWYHSHLATQYCDGLRGEFGPLVIYDPHDPHRDLYDFDDESTVLTISDWFHIPSRVRAASDQFPNPDSTLFNGKGRWPGEPLRLNDLHTVSVKRHKRYRLRVVSMACHANWILTVDNHYFTVIEADGISTEPLVVDSIQIFPAQRYSLILEADQPVGNYWIRAASNLQTNTTPPEVTLDGISAAILRYEGAPHALPTSTQSSSLRQFNESELNTLGHPGVPGKPEIGGADVNLVFDLEANASIPGHFFFTVNGSEYVSPPLPVLTQILSGKHTAQELLPNGSVFTIPHGKVVEVIFRPGFLPGGPHPFHMHGHAFDVVRSAGTNATNFFNPVRRDVTSVGGTAQSPVTDATTIRFVTDNSGPWIVHCHIDFHLNAGLAFVFAEDPEGTSAHAPVTKAWEGLCPAYDEWQKTNPPQNFTFLTHPSSGQHAFDHDIKKLGGGGQVVVDGIDEAVFMNANSEHDHIQSFFETLVEGFGKVMKSIISF